MQGILRKSRKDKKNGDFTELVECKVFFES